MRLIHVRSTCRCTLSLLTLLAAFGGRVYGQEVNASVHGIVQDNSGSVIPGVEVQVRSLDTNRVFRALTDESGNYNITQVPIGRYEVLAELQGFKKAVVTDIVLRVNDRRRVNFTLEVGGITEIVTVAASLVAVDTASGTTSSIMGSEDLLQLPSSGRQVMPFSMIMPGVTGRNTDTRTSQQQAVNGVRPTHNAWLLDGGYNIDTGGNWGMPMAPNMETVAEFRAIRGNYSAEFGIGGGSQFNVVTRGGSNEFHGALSWYHRADWINARNFFSPTKEPFRNNDFGGSIGGPVIIPGLYHGRDKTFFFAFFGARTERREERFTSKVPEMAYRTGDFSTLGTVIRDPATGEPFPGNIIPANRIDTFAKNYTAVYPAPNFRDSLGNNYTVLQPRSFNLPQQNYRIDHHFNERHRIFGRYAREFQESEYFTGPGFDNFLRRDEVPVNNTVINFYSTFSPTLLNEVSFTRSHNRIMQFPPEFPRDQYGLNIPELVPQTEENYPLDSLNLSTIPDKAPNIMITNYRAIDPAAPWSNYQSIFDFKDNLTWVRGRHTLKTGFDYAYEKKFEPADTNVFGAFNFDGRFTGDGYADFLLGRAVTYNESSSVSFNDNRRHALELYLDDSWKTSRRLTLNLGVRYSYFPPSGEPDERYRFFLPSAYDPAKAVTVLPNGQIPRTGGDRFNGLANPKDYWDYTAWNFAPRFGFAYDLFGNGVTAVRGGYGIFYSREILGAFILIASNPPFQERLEIENTSLSNPGGGSTRNFDLPINLSSMDTKQHTPYTQQWNLNIQQSLTRGTVLEVGYAGSRALHMMRSRDLNLGPLSADVAAGRINAAALRPYSGWGSISHREQSYGSVYHGLQIGLDRRFHAGLGIKAAYTWSKAIDDAEFTGGIYGVSAYYPTHLNGQRGPATYDTPHRFVASYIYQLPGFSNHNALVRGVLGGWSISGITVFESGYPFTPTTGRDLAGLGGALDQRPLVVGNWKMEERIGTLYFSPDAFALPAAGTLAPTGRNFMRLPGTHNWDLSLAKDFSLHERSKLEFRAEAFNAFNHTQFSAVGTSMNAANFGRVTTARSPRTMQLSMRITF
jgi:hypothetical protein